ncbi:MAG TPA: cyclic nucleotide-binding domain-containing protein [Aggregatilinea sp.]|uniref:Crp/Fnr family transcriptional regulator n=1 Tax=Aggregatilinea sp. TaxID=2806333 RepID=UPI002C1FBCF6|nr:cyclic nucleotide-binding domain-containing protein [Aggregatilinea sp.]HML25064.1 cyclic nucleotide-binding domain-containing protein [Aggregatilinea sp.]
MTALDDFSLEQAGHWLVTWGFAGEEFETLRSYAQEITFPARATIFAQGDPSDGMYLVLSGMVLIFARGENGTEYTTAIVTEGQSFGELGLLVGKPRQDTAAAGLDVRLLKIIPETLDRLEQEHPDLMMKMYKALAQTLADQWLRGGPWAERQWNPMHE